MLRGFARGAPREQRKITLRLVIAECFFRMSVNPSAVAAEGMEEEQLRSQRERRHIRFVESRDALLESGTDIHLVCVITENSQKSLSHGITPERVLARGVRLHNARRARRPSARACLPLLPSIDAA